MQRDAWDEVPRDLDEVGIGCCKSGCAWIAWWSAIGRRQKIMHELRHWLRRVADVLLRAEVLSRGMFPRSAAMPSVIKPRRRCGTLDKMRLYGSDPA